MRPIVKKTTLASPVRSGSPTTVPVNPRSTHTPSRGFGDTIEKVAKATGLDNIAKAYTAVTKKDCGCGKRKEALNKALPYRQQ